jgi:hypothetical protein
MTKGILVFLKLFLADNGLNDAIIDMKGEFGMSENSMAIKINSLNEGLNIKNTLLSNKFKDFIKSCTFGNFRIDWRLFSDTEI